MFFFIKWVGAYLVYLGVKCFFSTSSILAVAQAPDDIYDRRIWRDGFLLQMANHKGLAFFTAILPQFINPNSSIGMQVLILGISSIVVEFFVLLIYGQMAGKTMSLVKNARFEKASKRIAGSLLLGAGLGLARIRRS